MKGDAIMLEKKIRRLEKRVRKLDAELTDLRKRKLENSIKYRNIHKKWVYKYSWLMDLRHSQWCKIKKLNEGKGGIPEKELPF